MLKPFNELIKLDISKYTEKRKNLQYKPGELDSGPEFLEYLPWHKCLELLYENGAGKVKFEPIYTAEGYSVHYMPQVVEGAKKYGVNVFCPEVRVRITIDEDVQEFNYPLINGASVIKMDEISQQKVATAQRRAYVKGVAQMTGLGLRLWEKDEPNDPVEVNKDAHSIIICTNRIKEKYAEAVKRCGGEKELLSKLFIAKGQHPSQKNMEVFFAWLSKAADLEKQIEHAK